jgi:hypothetical protein
MSLPARGPLALALATLALGLGACGSGDEEGTIPQENSDALLAALAEVERNVESGDCTSATTDAQQFVGLVNDLPKEVGAGVKEDLRLAGENLVSKTQDSDQCQAADEPEPEPDTGATGEFGSEDGG